MRSRKMEEIRCSIREMVEFVSRSGHIISEINANNRAQEGTRIHQSIQKKQGEDYQAEVAINESVEYKGYRYIFQGRMDGLIINENGICIDEIKTVTYPITDLEIETVDRRHYHQLVCYAYFYSLQHDLKEIDGRLTYYQVDNKETKMIEIHFMFEEVKDIFYSILDKMHAFVVLYYDFKQMRNTSLENLAFPYESYREGQQEMMNAVYFTIKRKQKLFIQAATGLGKTLGTLFPVLRALLHGHTDKIMYLTAKTMTRTVAKETLDLLLNQGLKIRTTIITAKDRICFMEEKECHPDHCPYANHHYDRVNQALVDILTHEMTYDKEIIQSYALEYQVCPFEFSLDLFLFSDLSILDYNYAFDPRVNLQRAYESGQKLTLLIDEAHNLVDRAREMYSKAIYHQEIKDIKERMRDRSKRVYKTLIELEDVFIQIKNDLQRLPYRVHQEPPVMLAGKVENCVWALQSYLSKESTPDLEVLNLYFDLMAFMKIYELYDDSFVHYMIEDEDVMIKIYCIEPSHQLDVYYKKAQAVIFFSATLLPIQYFYRILGGHEGDYKLYYDSPFPKENRLVLVGCDVSTKYRVRAFSYEKINRYIHELVQSKVGNYLVFFSSYEYLEQTFALFEPKDHCYAYKQTSAMSNEEKENFLNHFKTVKDKSQVFFTVLGGMFSEGIDFKGEQLIGTIVVGVGLPQLGLERDLIKAYFEEEGYDYAYKYPGMNKVLQAAGRVIRTKEDRGVVILLDDRYGTKDYIKLFPKEWQYAKKTNLGIVSKQLKQFWTEQDEKKVAV